MNNLYITILFIISLSLFAYLLRNRPIISSANRNLTLDAFRGVLAPIVLTHHFILTYNWKATGSWEVGDLFVGNLGSIPVSLFFMITGYLFVGKIVHGVSSWTTLAMNRLLRIYPLYIFMLIAIFLVYFSSYKGITNANEISKSIAAGVVFFLRPLNDFNIGRVIAGVQWTLFYEAIFYISLPLISLCLYKQKISKIILPSLLSLIVLLVCFINVSVRYELFILFAIGGFSYFISQSKISASIKKYGSYLSIASIVISFNFTESYSILQMITIGILFVSVCCKSDLFGLLKSNGLIFLGDISYSIYLVHGFILYLLFTYFDVYNFNGVGRIQFYSILPFVMAIVVLVSSITYRYVEKPFLGKANLLFCAFKNYRHSTKN